jgi:hypothetical protein
MSALEDSLRAVYKLPSRFGKSMSQRANPLSPLERLRQPKMEIPSPTMMDGSPIPKGMTINPIMTMEYRDANQNGIEDRAEGLYRPGDLIPESETKKFMLDGKEIGGVPAPMDMQGPELSGEEQETLERLLQQTQQRSQAPLVDLTDTLQAAGTGEDTILAHLTPGEVILAPEFMDDPEFEKAVENKFKESGLDPASYVAGSGIANLNPQTGAPEYGFFKKIGKGLKKVVKKVAPVAMFIPGVGTALGAALGGIGGLAGSALTKVGLGGVASTLGGLGSSALGGIAKLGIPGVSSIAGGTSAGFGGIADALTTKSGLLGGGMFGETGSSFLGGPEAGKGLANRFGFGSGTAGQVEAYQKAQDAQTLLGNLTPAQRAVMDPKDIQYLEGLAAGGKSTGFMSNVSSIFGGGGQQQQLYDAQGNPVQSRGGIGNIFGGGGGGGGGLGNFAKMAGIGALSAGLGKLAYEDAKKQKGVGLTPLTTMSPTGRYNIEAEIARRMGQQRPNPVEFGLLPEGTLPQLSGGQPIQAALGGAIEELQGGMARGMQEGGTVDFGSSPRNVARDFLMRAEENPSLKQTPEYELASRSAAKGAPPELLPKIAENVIKNLGERDVAAFTDEEVTVEIMRQLRPYTGNSMSRSEVDAVRSMMNKMYAPKSQGIGSIMSMMGRTPIMAFAQGGAVAMQEGGEMDPGSFPRMDGDINGPGTEQSDDIPAMLSDGEFVMTARAVRGAGSYEMQTEPGGIINLVPSLEEDRERGMDVMYKVMDTFSGQANPS